MTDEEVAAELVVAKICASALRTEDPVERYKLLTEAQKVLDEAVSLVKVYRGRALLELSASGLKGEQIAEMTGIGSKQRVSQIQAAAKKS